MPLPWVMRNCEAVLYITSLDAEGTTAAELLAHVRGHWTVEHPPGVIEDQGAEHLHLPHGQLPPAAVSILYEGSGAIGDVRMLVNTFRSCLTLGMSI